MKSLITNKTPNSPLLIHLKPKTHLKNQISTSKIHTNQSQNSLKLKSITQEPIKPTLSHSSPNGYVRFVLVGATSIGVILFLMGMDENNKALALGPEGPLMEEFWDNVRRYALYALTVSTGALYAILQPIVELLKNPISAVLVLIIFGGGFYIVSQVLSAMVGVTEFNYDYSY